MPMRRVLWVGSFLVIVVARCTDALAASQGYTPHFLPPSELARTVGAHTATSGAMLEWTLGPNGRAVGVLLNETANLLLVNGEDAAVVDAIRLLQACDQPARQIALEARIVEVDTDRARDLGVEWSRLSASITGSSSAQRVHDVVQQPDIPNTRFERQQASGRSDMSTRVSLDNALHLLESDGAATVRDVPRVLTLNNRRATIFDGHRVTFATRANGYANLYVADTMDAGLKLEVTPSLLEGGQLRLQLALELTQLTANFDNFRGAGAAASLGGSPVKEGQMVENTIIARDGEAIVLGGFTRTVEERSRQRFPVLGRILPFLFSREVMRRSHHESLITLTPRVVDLATQPDAAQKKMLGDH